MAAEGRDTGELPFRTIFDLAAVAGMRELERAFHEAEAREMTDRVSLPQLQEEPEEIVGDMRLALYP